jgi:outer membrane receptor for monomeric catechols
VLRADAAVDTVRDFGGNTRPVFDVELLDIVKADGGKPAAPAAPAAPAKKAKEAKETK